MANVPLVSITPENLLKLKGPFLLIKQVPTNEEGNPEFSELDWLKICIKRYIMNIYRQGVNKQAIDAAQAEDNLID